VGTITGLKDVEIRKILPLSGLKLRPLGRPARSQSLYRLRYPGSRDIRSRFFIYDSPTKFCMHSLPFTACNIRRPSYHSGFDQRNNTIELVVQIMKHFPPISYSLIFLRPTYSSQHSWQTPPVYIIPLI
jgi:hypothetical protein